MAVALFLPDTESASTLLPWVARLAAARQTSGHEVIVLRASDRASSPSEVSLQSDDRLAVAICGLAEELGLATDPPPGQVDGADETSVRRPVRLLEIPASGGVEPVLTVLADEGVVLLVIPQGEPAKGDDPGAMLQRRLFLRAPCDTMMLRARQLPESPCRILVPTAGGPHSRKALSMAVALAETHDGGVTALFVEPRIGSEADAVGRRILDKIVRAAVSGQAERVDQKVIVGDDVYEGIAAGMDEDVDLVLCGTSYLGSVRRLLFGTLSDKILGREGPSVAVVRRAIPLASRLRQAIDRWLQAAVPQLDREGRLTLVERVQSNSHFDFDFVALLALSTVIAALGLVQNAAAVVIGAMLVAPLMTPLVGTGLALAQGNLRLIRNAMRSVVLGFCCAFVLGMSTGLLIPDVVATEEMLSRGSPTTLDLIVALLSGIAAAYASSRPHLSSALPGVAIAAALVPPIATSGIALSVGRPSVAVGAALLFGTNMVAIILGSAGCLWAVGFRASHQHGRLQRWVPLGIVLAIAMFGMTAWVLDDAVEIPSTFEDGVAELVRTADGEVLELEAERADDVIVVRVVMEGPHPASDALMATLTAMARDQYGDETAVRVESRLVRNSR